MAYQSQSTAGPAGRSCGEANVLQDISSPHIKKTTTTMFELKGINSDNKHPPATTWSSATMEVFNNGFNTQEQSLSSSGKQPEANGSKGLHRALIWLLSHAQQLCKQPCSLLVRMVNKRPWPCSGRALSFSLTPFGFGMKRLHKVSFSQTTQVVTCCVMAVDCAAVTQDTTRPFLLCENWW